MDAFDILLVALGGAAALAAVLVLVPAAVFRLIRPGLDRRIAAAIPAPHVRRRDLRANSLGLTSRGRFQARGNGALVLTGDALWFFQVMPRRDLRIPLGRVTAVGTARRHLGKSYGRDLLHVAFRAGTEPDSIAWAVDDLAGWHRALGHATEPGRR